jgi:hypothetical protein
MFRSKATLLVIALGLLLAGPVRAERLVKGRSLVLVGIGGHTGEFGSAFGAEFGRFESGELGGDVGYYHFFSDHWTFGISGGYYAGQLKIEGLGTYDTHSFTVRVGGDRYAFIDNDVALYAGPGVFLTRGRAKFEDTGTPAAPRTLEGPISTEVGLNGRIGMYARFGKGIGLFGHIGQNLSHTSGEDSTGKASWWSSTHEGSVGLAFDF